ncbi:MAG: malto-oligosyltrehalose synthase [Isosphaeraceae bacterium]|nr:malto-oligosyltrehalose synthase [Isosphaeraceae bacterium]
MATATVATARTLRPENANANATIDEIARALFDAELHAAMESPLRRPGATYRLQVHSEFRFDDVIPVIDYLADLGVTDCYFSPYLEARPGSKHGYDVFDHRRINPEIGDELAHDRLVAKLHARGMGRVLDVVPNHMGVGGSNRYWLDLLETGPQAASATMFEVDWHPVKEELEGRVLLPVLEDLYGKVLEQGLLSLERDGGCLWTRYHDQRWPLDPRSYARVLGRREDEFAARFEADDDEVMEYRSLIHAARSLPPRCALDAVSVEHVRREKEVLKRRLERLCAQSARIREFVDENVASFQGTPGQQTSFDGLHALLEEQVYRLAYWRVAAEEINYRRFFDVTELAGLRAEDPRVFDQTHELILRWVKEGGVSALRIDHPDGLADPLGYFRRLQERLFLKACRQRHESEGARGDWDRLVGPLRVLYRDTLAHDPSSPLARRFPIVAEKILSRGESLPADWPIDGTVGYEYLNVLNGLFVDSAAADTMDATYREFTGDDQAFPDVLHESKLWVEDVMLASELTMLARQLGRVSERCPKSRDFTLPDLGRALREVMACFRIYRTYQQPGMPISDRDREAIEQAVARARQRRPSVDESVYTYVRDVLLMNFPESLASADREAWERFVIRFQQTTGPVQAKGLEDTAFYRQYPLVSLNEVGADPARFGVSPSSFHALNAQKLNEWPGAFSTTATHDTKRGEDTRIRINVLAELAGEWRTHLARWSRWNARKKAVRAGRPVPDAHEEYLLYQILIGAWPFGGPADGPPEGFVGRIQEYMSKALSEAKRNTSWTDPDPSYKEQVSQFVAQVLEGADAQPFLADFLPFQRKLARIGVVHSLAQVLLKLGSPGAADLYQGCELWDLSLVDPDNRRPVDYELRRRLLDEQRSALACGTSRAELARRLYDRADDGAIKLYLVSTGLNHRKDELPLYQQGSYRPVDAVGERAPNVVAFQRQHQGRSAVIVAPRLASYLMGPDAATAPVGRDVWGDTQLILPDSVRAVRWRNLLTDEVLAADGQRMLHLGDVLQTIPLAWLVGD